jgi:hypothetical protein
MRYFTARSRFCHRCMRVVRLEQVYVHNAILRKVSNRRALQLNPASTPRGLFEQDRSGHGGSLSTMCVVQRHPAAVELAVEYTRRRKGRSGCKPRAARTAHLCTGNQSIDLRIETGGSSHEVVEIFSADRRSWVATKPTACRSVCQQGTL